MARVASGKHLQATTITTQSGTVYLLSYRPMPDYYAFLEREVIAQGKHYAPEGQAVSGEHFSATSITLAPGQQPITPAPTSLPAPPWANTKAALAARQDRWIRARVTIQDHYKPPSDSWYQVNLVTEDGTRLRTSVYNHTFESTWLPLKGKPLDIISALYAFDPAHSPQTTPDKLAAADFSIHAEVLNIPNLRAYSNVPLEGDGALPQSPSLKRESEVK